MRRRALRRAGAAALLVLLGAAASPAAEPLYREMTPRDVELANREVQRALEYGLSGSTFRWRNPVSGHSGSVTPLGTYRARGGFFCRRYEERLRIGERAERYRDTACRGGDGRWRPAR